MSVHAVRPFAEFSAVDEDGNLRLGIGPALTRDECASGAYPEGYYPHRSRPSAYALTLHLLVVTVGVQWRAGGKLRRERGDAVTSKMIAGRR